MLAGMAPMAVALGEGGEQTAPLGRAVIDGLTLATLGTLFIIPALFAAVRARANDRSISLDPNDLESLLYVDSAAPAAR